MNVGMRRTVLRRLAGLASLAAGPLGLPAARAAGTDVRPLAIKGYDPVAYFTLGKATRGRAELEYVWDERVYRFSQQDHRSRFAADPVRYLPQFSDYCAMALSQGEVVEADPEHWLVSDGKLYIFGKPAGPARFKKELPQSVAKANQAKALIPGR